LQENEDSALSTNPLMISLPLFNIKVEEIYSS